MKKLICFFLGLVMVMSLSLSANAQSTSPIVDNKASPPEFTAYNNHFQFDPVIATENDQAIPAPPFPIWGHNNNNAITVAPMAACKKNYKRFLGPGYSIVSSGPTGQHYRLGQYAAGTTLYEGLKEFISPGDRYLLGTPERTIYMVLNNGTNDKAGALNVFKNLRVTRLLCSGGCFSLTAGISSLSGLPKKTAGGACGTSLLLLKKFFNGKPY